MNFNIVFFNLTNFYIPLVFEIVMILWNLPFLNLQRVKIIFFYLHNSLSILLEVIL